MAWTATYDPSVLKQVISTDKPGSQIAAAITEIQKKAVTRVAATDGQIKVTRKGNKVFITLTPNTVEEAVKAVVTAALPPTTGQFQYQTLTLDTALAPQWDWIRAHG